MIAEINGKISSRGTNLTETLEDNLTGNFFGSLRYIPFSKGIKRILIEVISEDNFDKYELEEWAERIEFWPYHKEGELDAVINLNLVTIGVEVKYNSGLSSDDEALNEYKKIENSNNQLARESRIIKELAKEKGTKPILLFIARENKAKDIVQDVMDKDIIEKDVQLEYISWEDICLIIEKLRESTEMNYFERIVIDDIYRLLVKKGFNSFKSFESVINSKTIIEDGYYLFNEDKSNKSFDFKSDINIKEGEYYEFI